MVIVDLVVEEVVDIDTEVVVGEVETDVVTVVVFDELQDVKTSDVTKSKVNAIQMVSLFIHTPFYLKTSV